jgi:ATP-binding cassette subfamily B protein
MTSHGEFVLSDARSSDTRSTGRWVSSLMLRRWPLVLASVAAYLGAWIAYTQAQVTIGTAANAITGGAELTAIGMIALGIAALLVLDGVLVLCAGIAAERVATGVEADARREFFAALLAKSQRFHDRQRGGDIMARATDDATRLADLVSPGLTLILEAVFGVIVPIASIMAIHAELALVPIGFVVVSLAVVQRYLGRLAPVIEAQREQFGAMSAAPAETVEGIEVVKASGREAFERARFGVEAARFRDLFVRQGEIEARYLPLLLFAVALGLTFLHALLRFQQGQIDIGAVIGVMALVNVLRFPTFISIFAFTFIQSGVASAARMLEIIRAPAEIDANAAGNVGRITGEIVFDGVGFGYDQPLPHLPSPLVSQAASVLRDVSFRVAPGQTVAIVGQTGSGKSALTQLVNRTYDVTAGRVLVDGVDVRDWNLDALRSQIAKIEQDVFLFGRTIAENIAFGVPCADAAAIEAAARAAQAHEFIARLADGYATVVGERGVTLSGGQRQRIALARAFLADPRILILDDATSAIDSATEDQIQQAIRAARTGRTTLLITHRMAQIRWADVIIVLDRGRVVAAGGHATLLRRSPEYRRIFARFDAVLPPLEA